VKNAVVTVPAYFNDA